MPLPLAALVALSLGALFAYVARSALAQIDGPLWSSRPTTIVAAFAGFVYLPALSYFAAFHGDWAYMYFIAWRHVPSAIDLAVVAMCAALVPLAFMLAAPFARARRGPVVIAMMATPSACAALLAVVLQRRLTTNATFVQFSHDWGTHPAAASALGKAMLVAIGICAAASFWCVRLLRSVASKPR